MLLLIIDLQGLQVQYNNSFRGTPTIIILVADTSTTLIITAIARSYINNERDGFCIKDAIVYRNFIPFLHFLNVV